MFGDSLIWMLILPGVVLGGLAQSWVKKNVMAYSRVPIRQRLSGAEIARHILDSKGLYEVRIEPAKGILSDHYDPRDKTLRLSEPVYGARSIAAAGIAAHEAGHAIQDAEDYLPLEARSAIVPLVKAGSTIAPLVFFGGMMVQSSGIMWIGALMFGASTVFSLITLPVEFDASKRAKKLAYEHGIVSSNEQRGMDKVLDAAALTYVAAAVSSLMTLLYFLMRAGLLGGNRD